MKQRAPPAALGVLGQARLGHGHGEEPPALLGPQRRPLAADDRELLVVGRLGRPGEHAQLLAEQPVHQVRAGVPAAGEHLGGLEAVVELAAGDVGDRRPDRALEHDPLLVARDAALLAAVAVVLDDDDRLVPRGRDLDAEEMRAELVRRAEVDRLGLVRSLLDVSRLQLDAELARRSP